jgi:hypothetical protein
MFANCVLLFQDALTFQSAIALCYSQQIVTLQSHIPFPRTWIICELLMKVFSPIVKRCFEPKPKALDPWGCPPFYFNYMLRTSS